MKFKDNIPIFIQIKDIINSRIISGQYKMGQKVSSVRDFSIEFEVNMNTMQRALTELIAEGVLVTKRGLGNFITEDIEIIDNLEGSRINSVIEEMYNDLTEMGLSDQEVIYHIQNFMKEKRDE
ncbi:GntR family transcriptional regulator [Companilactobacillus sp. RD055328]|uniref:GntR family transcriptional regulator n=1 Tax=Companilactobacillus sp. RD055328 TaxID=2916634 RepID=UPI001FC893D6|nr:GntR family transcriptional regulator [Companilactobacillus sp. RD055328]GKQ42774.1 GntR family transcriptional regulator [Companilactobacillus sp. RD055328]